MCSAEIGNQPKAVTDDYLDGLDEDADLPFESIEAELLQATNNAIEEYNLGPRDPNAPMGAPIKDAYPNAKAPADRVRKLKALTPWQVASVIIRLYHAVGIRLNGQEGDGNFDVGVYQSDLRILLLKSEIHDYLRNVSLVLNETVGIRSILLHSLIYQSPALRF